MSVELQSLDKLRYEYKVIVLGDVAIGKTALVSRYCSGKFVDTSTTVGMECTPYLYQMLGQDEILLNIWDAAGQERFRDICPIYIKDTHAIILAYDITRPETAKALADYWIDFVLNVLKKYSINQIKWCIVGCKFDLLDDEPNRVAKIKQCEVSIQSLISVLEEKFLTASHYMTSSKTDLNIKNAFDDLVQALYIDRRTNHPVVRCTNRIRTSVYDDGDGNIQLSEKQSNTFFKCNC